LNLTEEEFWGCCPKEFNALVERHNILEEKEDRKFAILCMINAEPYRDKKKKPNPYKIEDFMPKYEQKREKKEQTIKEQVEMAKALNKMFGGEVK